MPGNSVIPAQAAPVSAGDTADTTSTADSATQDFTNYMKETPAQRFQDSWLKQHGISQEDFNNMSPAEQQKLLEQMKQDMEERMKSSTDKALGVNADITA